jgi:hypothetical protein
MTPRTTVAGRSRWPFLSLIPLGLGAWAPIYAGIKAHVLSWVLWGVLWCAVVVAGFVADSTSHHSGSDNLAGLLLIVGWVGAAATSFIIRGAYERQVGSPLLAAEEAGEQRLRERERAPTSRAQPTPGWSTSTTPPSPRCSSSRGSTATSRR